MQKEEIHALKKARVFNDMLFKQLQQQRRSIYSLGKNIAQTPETISDIVTTAVKASPTAFNNQSVRVVVLTGNSHDKLWQIVIDSLKTQVSDQAAYTKSIEKIKNSFLSAYGTVLFYTDMSVVKSFEQNVPLYAENFYDWSEQGHAIAEYATWLALTENGMGASLQHYNPLIDDQVAAAFNIPDAWRLRAQMPFGEILAVPSNKDTIADDERFKYFN